MGKAPRAKEGAKAAKGTTPAKAVWDAWARLPASRNTEAARKDDGIRGACQ